MPPQNQTCYKRHSDICHSESDTTIAFAILGWECRYAVSVSNKLGCRSGFLTSNLLHSNSAGLVFINSVHIVDFTYTGAVQVKREVSCCLSCGRALAGDLIDGEVNCILR